MQSCCRQDEEKEKDHPLDEAGHIYENPILEEARKDTSPTQQYLKLLNLSKMHPMDQDELISLFYERYMRYEPTRKFKNELEIGLQDFSSNFQAIKVSVRYGHFSTFLNLINIELQSPVRNLNQGMAGSQGKVYRFCFQNTPVAIKCFKIVQGKFQSLLRAVVKEYFLLAIASVLKAGPALVKIFGFDLLIFRDEICFSMEYCEMEHFEIDWRHLQQKLHLLHSLHIVHLDIKPENLGFSPRNNSFILIDFGLSKIIAEEIGKPSVSSFVGSMNFCSEEMLELFLKDRPGIVDLYLNDAICFDKTKAKMFEEFLESKVALQLQDYRYSNFESMSQRWEWHQFLNFCIKHQIKAQLFDLACHTICQTSILSQFSELTRKYQHQLRIFVSSLPQTFRLIYYYKTHLRTHLSIDDPQVFLSDSTIRKQASIDQAPILFVQRFRILRGINRNEGYEPQQSMGIPIEEVIFDRERIIKIKKSTYMLMLARFIRINSYHLNFEDKVTACKIYNEIFMKLQGVFSPTELYKLTVVSLFEGAVASLDQSALEILINLIETTVILEVVAQSTYSEAYTTILGAPIDLSQKMTIIIQFITSLEFSRQKYKTSYSYDHLLVSFFGQLNHFIDLRLSLPSTAKDEERLLFSVLKRFLARRAQTIISGCATIRQLMLFFDPQHIILGNRKLNDTVGSYIAFAIISDQLTDYHSGKQRLIEEIMMWIRRRRFKRNVFSYIHLAIYKATEKTYQERDNEYVYRLFYTQLHTFQEHRHFNIYLFNLINTVKRSFSKEHIRRKYEIHQKDKLICDYSSIIQNLDHYDEIFSILDEILKTSNNFHRYLDHLLVKPPAIYSSQVCKRYLKRLLQAHPQKIVTLSRPVSQHHFHYTDLKYEIFVVSHIFEYMSNLLEISFEEWKVILRKFMQQCQSAVAITDCLLCKIHGLLFVNQIYSNYIYIQGEVEESFLLIVESMILQMKNQRYYQNLMEFMVPTIRRWCKMPTIYKKYNLEGFLYDYIKLTGSHDYCLIDIKDFSIMPHLYLYIVRFLSQANLVDFMFEVTQKLTSLKSIQAVDNFYYAILFMIADNRRLGWLTNFKMYHDGILDEVLGRIDVERGPHMALYLYALLDIRLRSGIEPRMLKKISLSLKYIDQYSRKIIFNNYFEYLAIYSQFAFKKKLHICRQHLKLSSQIFNYRYVVNMKIGPILQGYKNGVKIRILKKCIKRYHKNIANIP